MKGVILLFGERSYVPLFTCAWPDRGDPSLTKRICGFDSRLLLGPVIQKTFKNGSGLFLHGTHDEGGTTKHNWSARCQYKVTG